MALVVGELTGVISLNADGVPTALRQAEGAMRASGQRMASDADSAGQQAGQQLGDGFVRGADGRIRDLRGRFVSAVRTAGGDATTAARRAGDDAGDALGDGLADSGGEGADEAGESIGQRLGARLKLAAAGAGIAAGAMLMAGMQESMDQSRITGRLAAQLGATPAEAQKYGKLAGSLYAEAVTEDFQTAADTISAVMRAGIAPPGATQAQLKQIATNVSDLASTFELDLGQTANAVGQMIKTGLAKNGTEALDALTAGMQRMGPRADDIADTFNEYSTIFRQMGLDATTATGLLSQGMAAGARDTDVVADSLKEFVLITQGGGKAVDEAFAAIGLSGKEMQSVFSKGGPEATAALDQVFDKLRGVKDPAKRAELALALFGTKAEDTQRALYSLDPSEATDALGQVGGKADEMGDKLRDNSGARLEAFKRGMQQNLVDFLGSQVVPRLEGVFSWMSDNKPLVLGLAAGITALGTAFAVASIGVWAMNSAMLANPMFWIIAGVVAILAGAVLLIVTYWDQIKAVTLAAWDWVVAKVVWAKDGILAAIAWFGTIPGKISGWFGQAKDWAVRKMTELRDWLTGLPGRIGSAISGLSAVLTGAARTSFQRFKDGAVRKGQEAVAWARGLPGQISRGIGSLGSLLYGKGQDVVRGLWNGIRSMGSWIKGQVMSWAGSVLPGPVAKALGIASPSKVFANEVGRWIPRGIVAGIESTAGEVDRTMANLVNVPTPSASYAGAVGSAVGAGGASGTGSIPTVRITGGDEWGDLIISTIRKRVGISGGDVQVVLGKGGR